MNTELKFWMFVRSTGCFCELFSEQKLDDHEKVKEHVKNPMTPLKNESDGEHQQGHQGTYQK